MGHNKLDLKGKSAKRKVVGGGSIHSIKRGKPPITVQGTYVTYSESH